MSATPQRRPHRLTALLTSVILACVAVMGLFGAGAATAATEPPTVTEKVKTANSARLQTWWHDNHEFNTTTPTQNDQVRRSSFHDVEVATTAAPKNTYDSFTYMSIPRSGKGKIGYTKEDGAEFASAADLTMSWSSFQYSTDVWVDVTLRTGQTITSADQVTIRPSS